MVTPPDASLRRAEMAYAAFYKMVFIARRGTSWQHLNGDHLFICLLTRNSWLIADSVSRPKVFFADAGLIARCLHGTIEDLGQLIRNHFAFFPFLHRGKRGSVAGLTDDDQSVCVLLRKHITRFSTLHTPLTNDRVHVCHMRTGWRSCAWIAHNFNYEVVKFEDQPKNIFFLLRKKVDSNRVTA